MRLATRSAILGHLAPVGATVAYSFIIWVFGLVLLTHQVGGFLGAWLGGKVFEATGSYDWLWYAAIVLAVGAALIHLPIKEARLVRPAMA